MRVLQIYLKTLFILLLIVNVRVHNVFLRLIYLLVLVGVCNIAVPKNDLHGTLNYYFIFLIKWNFLVKLFVCEHM